MANFIKSISKTTDSISDAWGSVKKKISEKLGIQDPLKILPYRGYGTPEWLYIKGRVLQKEGIEPLYENAPVWKNLRNMYRRFESDEIPNAEVEVCVGDCQQIVTVNEEGFFEAEVTLNSPLSDNELWHNIKLALRSPPARKQAAVTATGRSLVVMPTAKFGVISDIDDTVVYTAADSTGKMIRIAYMGNEHSRKPFLGVEPFYKALQRGRSATEGNPIFYVSSSPWNMYDLFDKFMNINNIPNGPILLRDIELSPANLLSFSHKGHKQKQVDPIFQRFPELPFILIGDSGQKDPEIYHHLIQQYPDRILAVYIRDAVPDDDTRREEIAAIAQSIRKAGVEFVLFVETATAAKHAASHRWIEEDAIAQVIPDTAI